MDVKYILVDTVIYIYIFLRPYNLCECTYHSEEIKELARTILE